MVLNFKDTKNEITNTIKNNSIINLLFGNIFILSIIIVGLIFIVVINNINITNDNNKLNYSYNISSIFIYSLIISVISLSIHDKLIKEDYIDKFKSKSEKEFADMMVGSAEKLVTENGQKNIDKDIENFLSKEY
jgi:ABC-type siderophore export system fused ATPase/permease subunit